MSKRRRLAILRKSLIIFFSAITCYYFFYLKIYLSIKKTTWFDDHEFISYNLLREEPIDLNQTCYIPRYHPFDHTIIKFVKHVKPISCRNIQSPLTFVDDKSILRFNDSAFDHSFLSKRLVKCTYSEVLRDNSSPSEDTFKLNTSKPFYGQSDVSHADFIQVECKLFLVINVYNNIHINIRDIPHKKFTQEEIHQKYNVLLYGIDSVSRLNAMRQLPKTLKYLKDILKVFVFRGYHKVGDNTFPNLATILTGSQPHRKPNNLLPVEGEMKPYDPWPFLWKNFSAEGYRTMFAEDWPEWNIFNHAGGGFKDQPTDHYARTYWKAVETTSINSFSSSYCVGSQTKHSSQINYVARLIKKLYGKIPFWAFSFLAEVSHDYITGQRIDTIRRTLLGSIEDNMPLFTIHLPERFRKSQPRAVRNLKTNVMRLTSPYDTYCTIIDILKLSIDKSHVTGRIKTYHGISMFGEIPRNRNCDDAGIELSYCTCNNEIQISLQEPYVRPASLFLVETINKMLLNKYGNYDSCARLSLKNIIEARIIHTEEIISKMVKIVLETSPGDGVLEGVVQIFDHDKHELIGNIERINRYGDQSICIKDKQLRAFCY
ncbi:hypothetical protein GQR58_022528 [Nymphon striatum]|nr:hypothetical protein GQR58_022528 [Nymphon striatum]